MDNSKKRLKFIDLTGYEDINIIVIERAENRGRTIYWKCKCKYCGEIFERSTQNIKNGLASCKCIHYKKVSNSLTKPHRDTELYSKWCGMKSRCFNSNELNYKNYGARGITMCDEWLSFDNFYEWSINNGWEKGYFIERNDVNKNYCPENCSWIPLIDQAKNKRNTLFVEVNGVTKRLKEWCEIYGKNYKTVYQRIKLYGLTPIDALTCSDIRNFNK